MRVVLRLLLLFLSVFGIAHAADPWGNTWGESFSTVRARFPEAEYLDNTTMAGCESSTAEHCLKRQVILHNQLIGNLPSRIIFGFARNAKLNSILIFLEDAGKYTPQRLGIAFDQIVSLLGSEHGEPMGKSAFTLAPSQDRFQKDLFNGSGMAVWHTKDSIISVELTVQSAASESTPTGDRRSFLYVGFKPLQLFSAQ